MYIKLKSNVIFRNYDDFGYITDNMNFGYKQANDPGNDIGDKIVSQSGAVFLSVLSKKPQKLDYLAKKICLHYPNVDIETIQIDVSEFYNLLELDGYITSGQTIKECNEKDSGFSYKEMEPQSDKKTCSPNISTEKSTQDFFDEYFNNKPQLTNLHIDITSNCNEKCVHCYIPNDNKTNNIKSDLFYSILRQSKKMNLLHITLSGGEPMLHPKFINFLRKCNKYNLSINVLSNLTLLNKDMLEEMKKNPLLSVQVSLYSMDENIHDAITQTKKSFIKTKNAILELIKNNIPLQISCPIIKQNLNTYNDVINWGKAHNINVSSDYVIIARHNHTTQNLDNRLSIGEVKKLINQRIINKPKYMDLMEKEAEKNKNMKPDDFICSVCHSSICIAHNGDVFPCPGWQSYVVGNMNEASLNDIWNGSTKIQYLRNLRKQDFPKCIQCTENEFCTMCMVRNANEDPLGDPLVVNEYFCNIAKLNKKMYCEHKCNLINSQGNATLSKNET